MLVSATEMINKAHEGHYAIGAFNINNLEWTKAILAAAEEAKSPVMLGVSEGASLNICVVSKQFFAMVKRNPRCNGNYSSCSFTLGPRFI